MILIPTVDDWFQLARRYPKFKMVGASNLKDYGVMACMAYVEDHFGNRGRDLRVLEFGHGFNPDVMARFQEKHEVWGADRDQGLPYFASVDWELEFARAVAPKCKSVRFVRELLSTDAATSQLPDVLLSVSVLEEMPMSVTAGVIQAAARKLKPGGVLIGTHDLELPIVQHRLPAYLQAQRDAGLLLETMPDLAAIDWRYLLLEQPLAVMIWYQGHMPEEQRRFIGHHGTVFTAATKRL